MIALALLLAASSCAPADTLYIVDSTAVVASMTLGIDPKRKAEHARFLQAEVIGWQAALIRQRAHARGLEIDVVTNGEGFSLTGRDVARASADVVSELVMTTPRIALHAVVDDAGWPKGAAKKAKGTQRSEKFLAAGGVERAVTVVDLAPAARADFVKALAVPAGRRLAFELYDGHFEARLLEDPPVLVAADFAEGRLAGPDVAFTTTDAGKAQLAQATQALEGRRLAILVDDEIVAVPVVGAAITNGTVSVTSGGLTPEERRARAAKLFGQVKLALHPVAVTTRCRK